MEDIMKDTEKNKITVQATVKASIDKAWTLWTSPEHVIKWNQASEDWHTTRGENDLKVNGKFLFRMEAKNGSFGFDFSGVYTEIIKNKIIAYTMDDDRKVKITFDGNEMETRIEETFEAEETNSPELQRNGWQAILESFKKYVETY